ncbi:MAG: hypothetical protein DYG92_01915 [Leptolyngbya sp. PLA1]|nr:hypothetical protein [Leptolyngbya sp. PLA1]
MPRINLAGTWQIRHDPLSQGTTGRWWKTPPADGWKDIEVPSAWQTVLGPDAGGVAWYRRDLPAEALAWARAGRRVRLCFESAATDTQAWVGGRPVGRSLGDYAPFEFDITEAVLPSELPPRLTVRVDQVNAPRPAKGVVVENGHITKGFHDVLSLQHAGLWGEVSLRDTGEVTLSPNGLYVDADAATGVVRICAELTGRGDARLTATLRDPSGTSLATLPLRTTGEPLATGECVVNSPRPWSPDDPALYEVHVELASAGGTEHHSLRFGFRTIRTGAPRGQGNSHILLNDSPLFIRGVLYWGHEPRHISPAQTPDEIRREFELLRAMGFNLVCLCMYYPPEHFYEIADEAGMLVWQEHPVWKSRMTPDTMPEYRRMFERFLRRDRRHPSVVIVSATCEHEAFDADLARWWWETSGNLLPRTLRQIQTGFLEWTPPEQTDLYDDHVYDNHGRWVRFVDDIQARIDELPEKPFVMGETIISNAWPDIAALREAFPGTAPWFLTRGLAECDALEREIVARWGEATLSRFRADAAAWGSEHRRFQIELLRTRARNAGFVTNSIRDVPICRLGLMDDANRWRFTPEDFRPSIADRAFFLLTQDHTRAFLSGEDVPARLGLSNFARHDASLMVHFNVDGSPVDEVPLSGGAGVVTTARVTLRVPHAESSPRVFVLEAHAEGVDSNRWPCVSLPSPGPCEGVAVQHGLPPLPEGAEFEELSYSSGWGLPCRTWTPLERQDPAWSGAAAFAADTAPPAGTRVALAAALTPALASWVLRGGRCVLLASRHSPPLVSRFINLWGLVPLILEGGPILAGESAAVRLLLPLDLTRRTIRAIPSQDLGIAPLVDPIVRFVYTHDAGVPKVHDAAMTARLGSGVLLATTLDHTGLAGRWLLGRLLTHAATAEPPKEDISRLLRM